MELQAKAKNRFCLMLRKVARARLRAPVCARQFACPDDAHQVSAIQLLPGLNNWSEILRLPLFGHELMELRPHSFFRYFTSAVSEGQWTSKTAFASPPQSSPLYVMVVVPPVPWL